MRKNNTSFKAKQRQSQWAIIFIVISFIIKFLKQLWPILLALTLGRGSGLEQYEIIAAGIGGLSMISSILSYFKFYFYISDQELIIEKGILKKVRLDLPFDRIQSVNFEQNFLHQILNVTSVEIESAGSEQKELKIDALKIPIAEKLREEILKRKEQISADTIALESTEIIDHATKHNILQLDIQKLLRVGLTQNHLKPIGLLFSLFGSLFAYGWTVDGLNPIEMYNYVRSVVSNANPFAYTPWSLLLIPFTVLYSLVTTVLKHYDLDFSRMGRRFHVVRGLFNKQQFSAMDKKIQIMSWSQNPLEKKLGFHNICFRQARSGDGKKNKQRFEIPGCSNEHVSSVKNAWLKKLSQEFRQVHTVSVHLFKHTLRYQLIFFGALIILMSFLTQWGWLSIIVIWAGSTIFLTWKKYTKTTYALNPDCLFIGGGMLGFKNSICPIYKIQNLALTQNYYQSKRNLATLKIYSAAGAMNIPYIEVDMAYHLMNRLIKQVEISQKSWI